MLIASDTELTSASARSFDTLSPLQLFDASYVGTSAVSPVLVARRRFLDVMHEPDERFSGVRGAYGAHLTINSPSATSFLAAGSGRVRYTVYGAHIDPIQLETSSPFRLATIGNELDATIFQVWTLGSSPAHQSLAESVTSLRDIVAAIARRSPFRLSDETEAIVQQAAGAHGTPEDIDAWARRLAEDVRDLSD